MRRSIKFCLLYRDMWQSSGKYVPRVDQLVRVAAPIIDMGCFSRVETNGGGFEQINLLFGENPNRAVREWTQPFNEVGIQTQMLERGLNGLRMNPVPRDVRELMFRVKKKQGTDIARSFDGLNDARNIADSIGLAKQGGMIAQAALSITHSPIHTVDYYLQLAAELIDQGAEEICIKDMAGIGRPVSLGKIVAGIKGDHPNILVQYHGHSGPGFSVASALECAQAGADIIDVGMEPLSWGTGHADLLTVHAMLQDAGFEVAPINHQAYMEVRRLTQEFIDDFLGLYINPQNRLMNSLLIRPGLPGGMMGSLMADLENNLQSLNKALNKRNQAPLTQEQLLVQLFDEVAYIWPKMGYPPLVTPYSQYVKNVALMNVMLMAKEKPRWSIIDDNTWDMLLGKAGRLPGELAPELKALAKQLDKEFFSGHPQSLYPDSLSEFRDEMEQEGWDIGQDEEELMELAMHPKQYRAYKSGAAKAAFEKDLAERKAAKEQAATSPTPGPVSSAPKTLYINVNGEQYVVGVSYGPQADEPASAPVSQERILSPAQTNGHHDGKGIMAPLEGTFSFTKEADEQPVKVGDRINQGDVVGYIEAMKVSNAVRADQSGEVVEILVRQGSEVEEDQVLLKVR